MRSTPVTERAAWPSIRFGWPCTVSSARPVGFTGILAKA